MYYIFLLFCLFLFHFVCWCMCQNAFFTFNEISRFILCLFFILLFMVFISDGNQTCALVCELRQRALCWWCPFYFYSNVFVHLWNVYLLDFFFCPNEIKRKMYFFPWILSFCYSVVRFELNYAIYEFKRRTNTVCFIIIIISKSKCKVRWYSICNIYFFYFSLFICRFLVFFIIFSLYSFNWNSFK